jgi:hypothetical protein
MLVNRAIPALIGGVSQQPAPVRHASQVDECENMIPSVVTGLRSRPGTYHQARVDAGGTNVWTDAYGHWFENEQGRYFLVINNASSLKVFDENGTEIPVAFPAEGTYYLEIPSTNQNYIPARTAFKAVTVADYTFITNKYKTVVAASVTPVSQTPQAYAIIKVGVIKTTYTVTLNGADYSYTTGDATTATGTDTQNVALELRNAINGGGTFTATVQGNLLIIEKSDGADFSFAFSDSWGNQGMFGFKSEVNRYEDLPKQFVENRVVKVNGDPNNANSAWYVHWKKDASNADGVWEETTPGNIPVAFNAMSMPHQLVQQTDGSFVLQRVEWGERETGDDTSNPFPSFVDRTINDIFFHRNRLGFLSDENVIMSQAGDYYQFFAASARAVLDSDPIDVSASTNEVAILNHVVPFEKSLLLFSDRQQFIFEGGEVLTPRTAKIVPSTSFHSYGPKPAALGRNVFFGTTRGSFANIREYYYDGGSVTNDAMDTTIHCPSYIPYNLKEIVALPSEDMVIVQTVDERNCLYLYNSYWNGEEKVQSAWHKWRFDEDDQLVTIGVFGSRLAVVTQRPDGLFLDYLDLSPSPASPTHYEVKLDRWVRYDSGLYDSTQKKTFWTLPYDVPEGAEVRVITTTRTGDMGQGLRAEKIGGGVVAAPGNYTNTDVVVGLEFDSWFRFSRQFNSDGKDALVVSDRIQIRDFSVSFANTGYFEAHVTPDGRDTRTYVYSGRSLGLVAMLIGKEVIERGEYKIPVMARNSEVDVEIHNHTHLPCRFIAAEWQGHIAMQARR